MENRTSDKSKTAYIQIKVNAVYDEAQKIAHLMLLHIQNTSFGFEEKRAIALLIVHAMIHQMNDKAFIDNDKFTQFTDIILPMAKKILQDRYE